MRMRTALRLWVPRFTAVFTVFFTLTLLVAPAVRAQEYGAAVPSNVQPYSAAELDQMLAPIALYPDSLLGPILIASTYPLEVVEAHRWLQDPYNASLRGDALAAALQQQTWDPSVKTLVAYPQILEMMDNNLDWTERLGDAFLAQQDDVMDAVQRLRSEAEEAGTLESNSQQEVTTVAGAIVIAPVSPAIVYVPVYNPLIVFGVWPYPDYPPFFFPWAGVSVGINVGFRIFEPFWGWGRWDWRHHRIDIDSARYNRINVHYPPVQSGPWKFNPEHRHDVPFRSPATRARFRGVEGGLSQRQFRGYAPRERTYRAPAGGPTIIPAPRVIQPTAPRAPIPARTGPRVTQPFIRSPSAPRAAPRMERRMPPAFESYGRGREVRTQEQRGARSRQSAPSGNERGAPRGRGWKQQ